MKTVPLLRLPTSGREESLNWECEYRHLLALVWAVQGPSLGSLPEVLQWGTASACQPLALGSTETFSVYYKQISISVMNIPWHGITMIRVILHSWGSSSGWTYSQKLGYHLTPVVLRVSHSAGWNARVQPLLACGVNCTPWWWHSQGLRTQGRGNLSWLWGVSGQS